MRTFTNWSRIGLAILASLVFTVFLKAQDAAVNMQGNTHISGVGEFNHFSNDNSTIMGFGIRLGANRFVIDRLYFGPSLSYSLNHFRFSYESIFPNMNTLSSRYRSSRIQLGPSVGYVFGNEGASIFPFIQSTFEAGILNEVYEDGSSTPVFNYDYEVDNEFVYEARFGGGLLIPIARTLALNMEVGYRIFSTVDADFMNVQSRRYNHFYFGIGLTGLL